MALELIMGSMFSGKSTELIHRVQRLQSIGMKCCVINHSNDTRVDGGFVQTHDGQKIKAIKTDELMLVRINDYDAIAIDEGQFFTNLKTAVTLMLQKKKFVIVSGLNGDFNRNAFGEMSDLVSIADDITFKRAICRNCCHPGKLASFTKRLGTETATVSIHSKYTAVCRYCYETD
tara:strand:- start:838 stop:1362 length:525 start_codon:yes stop_codon:yes gene_type:complete